MAVGDRAYLPVPCSAYESLRVSLSMVPTFLQQFMGPVLIPLTFDAPLLSGPKQASLVFLAFSTEPTVQPGKADTDRSQLVFSRHLFCPP